MKYKNILTKKYNNVMHIILNRKDKYNALNNELTDELIDALRESCLLYTSDAADE